MSISDESVQLLKSIYQSSNRSNKYITIEYSRDDFINLPKEKRNKLEGLLFFMEDKGWISKYHPCIGAPISYKLTSKGIEIAEGVTQTNSSTSPIFNINNFNGILGDNAQGNVFNYGSTIEDFKKLVADNEPSTAIQKEILESLQALINKINANQPIEKGCLEKIGSKIQNCSWLSGPIVSMLLKYFTGI